MLLGDSSEANESSRKGRKHATNFSPTGRSFSIPIQARGSPPARRNIVPTATTNEEDRTFAALGGRSKPANEGRLKTGQRS
jgi:hypothetical protein